MAAPAKVSIANLDGELGLADAPHANNLERTYAARRHRTTGSACHRHAARTTRATRTARATRAARAYA
eukprot:CAMPEP_0185491264 /NCGR_PEP_ID=MMETSP1366-20130426/14571_1 /TAXON_ID=38817 /ORGANISM="Gephyrocapsa oceanica, Strain RCC1303" /LENGTH=67 /DNA_ID=CAMNT_0028100011 /DNA_START=230 /DNA_END=430 /DNA_ORIENTATION=-